MQHTSTATGLGRLFAAILALTMALAMALCMTPVAAFADDEEAATTTNLNENDISTTDDDACGVIAKAGATIIANALNVQTKGARASAVSASASDSAVSIVNSQLSTSGSEAPLLSSAGTLEAENVQGTATKSPIVSVLETGSVLVANSTLESSYAGNAKDALPTSAIALYGTSAIDATSEKRAPALFQATGSTLKSAIDSGAFFYLTNTQANILLVGNILDFDTSKAKLLMAAGSDVASDLSPTSDTASFGTAGKNGATVTLTAIEQKLEGDIVVDSISSVDIFLLDGSSWTGSCDITANAAGADLADNIAVNIDATSGWVVTEDSTVSSLNIEKGGKLVDADGKAVTIVDADGNKLVDGASDVEVAVADTFTTTVKTTDANSPKGSAIDRTAFDEEFGTSTAFGTNGTSTSPTDEERAAELQAIIVAWFNNL